MVGESYHGDISTRHANLFVFTDRMTFIGLFGTFGHDTTKSAQRRVGTFLSETTQTGALEANGRRQNGLRPDNLTRASAVVSNGEPPT